MWTTRLPRVPASRGPAHPEDVERALAEPHVGPMTFTGRRAMRGFVVVDAAGIEDPATLARWVDEAAACAASLPPK